MRHTFMVANLAVLYHVNKAAADSADFTGVISAKRLAPAKVGGATMLSTGKITKIKAGD